MTKEEIGAFILNERKKQKLSQKTLAEKAGLSRWQQVLEIEKCQFNFSIESLIKIVKALGLKVVIHNVDLNDGWKSIPDDVISPVQPEPNATASFVIFDFSKTESAKEEINGFITPNVIFKKGYEKINKVIIPFKRKKLNHVKNS